MWQFAHNISISLFLTIPEPDRTSPPLGCPHSGLFSEVLAVPVAGYVWDVLGSVGILMPASKTVSLALGLGL